MKPLKLGSEGRHWLDRLAIGALVAISTHGTKSSRTCERRYRPPQCARLVTATYEVYWSFPAVYSSSPSRSFQADRCVQRACAFELRNEKAEFGTFSVMEKVTSGRRIPIMQVRGVYAAGLFEGAAVCLVTSKAYPGTRTSTVRQAPAKLWPPPSYRLPPP